MTDRRFAAWALLLLGVYLVLEVIYTVRFPLIMDEFEGAYSAFQFRTGLPYRDFLPYKTVLGYYAQLPILLLPFTTWTNLLLLKCALAVAVAASLFAAVWLLRERIDRRAILASLALLLAMSTFLERSAELRVDMLTAAVGLLSLVLLMRERPGLAGLLAGLSFLVSQKGIYYGAAAAAAYLLALVFASEQRRTLRDAIAFGAACLAIVAAYLAFWSAIASPHAVLATVFGTATKLALLTDYSDIRAHYWIQTISRNPFFYTITIGSIMMLSIAAVRDRRRGDCLLAGYVAAIAVFGITTRQPWPYFFVIILPTALVTNAEAIARLLASRIWSERRALLMLAFVAGGIVLPLTRLAVTLRRDNTPQRANIELAERIVGPGERYLAAVDLLYRREQSLPELRWLDRVSMGELYARPPAELDAIVRRLDRIPTKVVVFNYRIDFLPPPIRQALQSRFAPLSGNVLIYAPTLAPGPFALQFGGTYVVSTDSAAAISIDGRPVATGTEIQLARGAHVLSGGVARLKLRPAGAPESPQPLTDFFPNVYDF
ncbi:MAG: hypothetical protein JWO56_38 [Acidobacteria bacterium]|nr:hypothetical protein [Acidobacteriota bacterium]